MKVLLPFANHKELIMPETREILEKADFEVISNDTGRAYNQEQLKEAVKDMDAIFAGGDKYTAEVLENAPKLKILARFGVGMENVDLDACKKLGIKAVRGVNNNAVAEHAVMLMLSVLRQAVVYDQHVREGRWPRANFHEISGKTIGIVGFGHIGRRVAEILSGFQVKLLIYDPFIKSDIASKFENASIVSLQELISGSDIVTFHIPGTAENYHLIGANEISSMKDGAIIINTARGSIIDQAALTEAIISGKLSGAGLDVLEQEPPKADDPILKQKQVILSSHVASGTYEAHLNMGNLLAEAIIDVFNGVEPKNQVI